MAQYRILITSDIHCTDLETWYGVSNAERMEHWLRQIRREQEDQPFDLIYSATAFHWVDSAVGYPKAWRMLKDSGSMAVFWHMSSVMHYDCGIFPLLYARTRKTVYDLISTVLVSGFACAMILGMNDSTVGTVLSRTLKKLRIPELEE